MEYVPITSGQKYCGKVCAKLMQEKQLREKNPYKCKLEKKTCPQCSLVYQPRVRNQRFCSIECKELGKESVIEQQYNQMIRDRKKERIENKVKLKEEVNIKKKNYGSYINLNFKNEHEFHQWFDLNYSLFGIKKIINSDVYFPDIIAEMDCGSLLAIELEFHASNFLSHSHCVENCDLIISFLKNYNQTNIKGIPIISIFNTKGHINRGTEYDPLSIELTDYFEDILNYSVKKISSFVNQEVKKSKNTIIIEKLWNNR
jgi:hypothetical protein